MTRRTYASVLLVFLMLAAAPAKPRDYFYIPEKEGKSFEPGLPNDFCEHPAVVGTEPLEVVLRSISLWNHITGLVCGAECRNPGEYVDGSLSKLPNGDYAFEVRSLCTGWIYPRTLFRRECPDNMRLSDARLTCVPDRTH